jgi:hypothetical protein
LVHHLPWYCYLVLGLLGYFSLRKSINIYAEWPRPLAVLLAVIVTLYPLAVVTYARFIPWYVYASIGAVCLALTAKYAWTQMDG